MIPAQGIYESIAVDVSDPTGQGRIRVQAPQALGTARSNWARPAFLGGYAPKIGSKVFIAFLGGDPNSPVYFPNLAAGLG
jgi:uncharacterized protein involved in type VI secretion and phage assembly